MIPPNLLDLISNDLAATLYQFDSMIKPTSKQSEGHVESKFASMFTSQE